VNKSLFLKIAYILRDILCRKMFPILMKYCQGRVLDVGGWDFYLTAKRKGFRCSHWITLEYNKRNSLDLEDEKHEFMHGDGCNMPFPDNSFDTILNIHVLEHVLEPLKMLNECARVLKPGGYGIFLLPQSSVIHLEPNHFYNFTIFWSRRAMPEAGLEIIEEEHVGGVWSSMASHLIHMVAYSIERKLKSPTGCERNVLFYLFYPLMLAYAVINIPICLFFSLGDFHEEANSNLIVVRKPGG